MHFSTPETRASLILRLPDAADVAAWDSFESIYAPVIQRVALRQGLQPADVENVVQEVLLRVAKSVGRWLDKSERGPFHAWLMTIARNETVRLLSRPATRPWAMGDDSRQPPLEEAAMESQLSGDLDREYQREVFLWAADQVRHQVAEKTWMAFWLTQIEGLSVAEAAERLGIDQGNIYFCRSRVMSRLKSTVQQFEEQQ
jgi:RNA polymerase sigma-70 factor, ECF subfamily